MIDKITLSLMLFFNTLTSSIDPSLSDERKSVNQIKKEIKSLERKIEWIKSIQKVVEKKKNFKEMLHCQGFETVGF